MTAAVLERGTPTPPGRLVFVPMDGREIEPLSQQLFETLPPQAFGSLYSQLGLSPTRRGEILLAPMPRSASWVLVDCLISLRSEFNRLAPDRDKVSDGSIGDTAHASSSSDPNPDETGATPYADSDRINDVHAIDVDKDLRRSGWTMARAVGIIVDRHRRGLDDRLQNVIFNGKIYSRSWGWTARDYSGSNPHDKHAHFSARYTTAAESDTSRWGLLDDTDTTDTTDKGDDEMNFWASAAKAARGDDDATAEGRDNRNNAVQVIRFALGLQVPEQKTPNIPSGPAGQLARIETAALKILAKVTEDDGEAQALLAEIQRRGEQTVRDIVAGLAAEGSSPAEIAAVLEAALGDRSTEVGRLLAAGGATA